MRKNTARHWLHAGLDLLPLILIPVFMIYSHRHTMTQQTSVDIQYKYQSNEVNDFDELIIGNIYNFKLNNFYIYEDEGNYIDFNDVKCIIQTDQEEVNTNYVQYYTTYYLDISVDAHGVYFSNDSYGVLPIEFYFQSSELNSINVYIIYNQPVDYSLNELYFRYFEYTDFNLIDSVDVHDETSSVMNVFVDNFNGAIDKYFNMGNVFGMTNVYQWFNTNIFGGNAPTIIFSVWNIVLYEFVMDLLFLLYALFMWFIDVTKRLIEKPLNSIK